MSIDGLDPVHRIVAQAVTIPRSADIAESRQELDAQRRPIADAGNGGGLDHDRAAGKRSNAAPFFRDSLLAAIGGTDLVGIDQTRCKKIVSESGLMVQPMSARTRASLSVAHRRTNPQQGHGVFENHSLTRFFFRSFVRTHRRARAPNLPSTRARCGS